MFRRVLGRGWGYRWMTDAGRAPRALPAVHGLCHQARELVGGECEHGEHAVAHHFRGATDPDMATTELVLQTGAPPVFLDTD